LFGICLVKVLIEWTLHKKISTFPTPGKAALIAAASVLLSSITKYRGYHLGKKV
jgi:hypothetical protein